jgi:hypothetical protein
MGVGTKDRLSANHRNFENLFDQAGVPFESYYLGGMGHTGGVSQTESYYQFIRSNRRDPDPEELHFATLHLAHSERAWIRVEGLKHHYKRAFVHATAHPESGRIDIETKGVTRLSIEPGRKLLAKDGATTVTLDRKSIPVPALHSGRVVFESAGGSWQIAGDDRALRKRPGLTGPVSDAFTKPFLCVRPTGTPWSEDVGDWAAKRLDDLRKRWSRTERGVLPVKDDRDVTEDDIRRFNLVVYGDPGSNRLLSELLPKMQSLDLRWTRDNLTLGARSFSAATHAPVLVYPNPSSPGRYVVVNGILPERAIRRSRSTTVMSMEPPIGDYAVVEVSGGAKRRDALALGGFFNESWALETR